MKIEDSMTTEEAGERWNLSTSTVKELCMGERTTTMIDIK